MFGNTSCCIQKLFCIIKHCCSQNMFCVLERLFAGYNLFKLFSFKLFIAHASCMLLLSAPPTGGSSYLLALLPLLYIWAMHCHHWWCCWYSWFQCSHRLDFTAEAHQCVCGQYSWHWPIDDNWDTLIGVKYKKTTTVIHTLNWCTTLCMYVCMYVCHHV